MPLLQVRDCPEDVYEALRERAKRENRSIAQQTITILQEHLGLREPSAKPAMPAQPSRPLYGDKPDDVDYLAKHAAVIERLESFPPIPITDDLPCADVLLAQIREEEAR